MTNYQLITDLLLTNNVRVRSLSYEALIRCVTIMMAEWCPSDEGTSDMDIDRGFLKELHSLKDRVPDSVLLAMVNSAAEGIKGTPDAPKHLGEWNPHSAIILFRFFLYLPLQIICKTNARLIQNKIWHLKVRCTLNYIQ